ncbi:MAG: hypothetical protein HYV06_07875 [Deltaproteobacteria bacterium]|nr:hypothetical protein [Deltaproteobacteria bacterium]
MDNLTSIKHVQHTDDSEFKELISEGWMLLHVYSQTTDNRVKVFYVMGHEGPIEETESKYPEVLAKLMEKNKEN